MLGNLFVADDELPMAPGTPIFEPIYAGDTLEFLCRLLSKIAIDVRLQVRFLVNSTIVSQQLVAAGETQTTLNIQAIQQKIYEQPVNLFLFLAIVAINYPKSPLYVFS